MLKRLLLDPVAVAGGGGSAVAAPPKPAATPAASPAPAAAPPKSTAAPAAVEPASADNDDPFAPPPKAAAPKPGEKAAPAPAPAPALDEDEDKIAPKELRLIAKRRKQDLATANTVKAALEAKIKSFESQGKDTTALTSRLTAVEKERDSALAELRATKQEASPEFKEKYDKPFNMAAERAKKQILELAIAEHKDDAENITQPGRPATWEDFSALYSLPAGKAIEQAEALFGKSANFVLGLREKLLDLDNTRQNALQEERTQFKQRTEQEIAGQALEKERVSKTWVETNQRLAQSNPDYKNEPEDTELNEARKHALGVYDGPVQAADREDFINKRVIRDAHIRQRVGAFPVLKLQLSRAQEKITALEAQVLELKGTEAGKVRRSGGGEAPGEDDGDWGSGLKKAVAAE